MFCKKGVLKNFVKLTGKKLSRPKACNVIKKETPSQVFSCKFCEIFKTTFFIDHLRWLLLPILKPLDSQRHWCKWISKLLTIYFISAFLVLVGIFVFIFGKHKLSFYSTALWLRKYDVFDFSRDRTIEVSRDFLGGAPLSWVSTLPSLRNHGTCERRDKTFLICHVTM